MVSKKNKGKTKTIIKNCLIFLMALIITPILSIPLFILMVPFLNTATNGISEIELSVVGAQNMWRIVAMYGLFTIMALLFSYFKRKILLFSIAFLVYWILGTSFVAFYAIPALSSRNTQAVPSQITKITPLEQVKITPTIIKNRYIPTPTDNEPWGVAKQIGEYTWTMKVGMDARMATPQEILDALNTYRNRNGRGSLAWNTNLATYADTRCNTFVELGSTDSHEGFNKFLDNEENYKSLGFSRVGENSSYGFRLLGVHLIEWMYGGDEPHDSNQLNSAWSNVGICVKGTATDLIFGG